jgi:aminopeptidase N
MKRAIPVFLLLLLAIPVSAQRLPRTVIPEHYTIHLTPDLGAGTFEGEETIKTMVKEPVTAIELNAVELDLRDVTVSAHGKSQPATVTADAKTQIVHLALPSAIPKGAAEIHLRFAGKLNEELHGFYQSHTARRKYAVTQFEPADARRAFPCFDEPDLKATFDISATVDAGDTAISNGRIISDQPGPGTGKHTLRFSTSPRMSTYLSALTVGDFQCSADTAGDTPIRVCVTPENAGRTRFALDAAKASLTFYEGYFGMKYPFGKLDITEGPDFIEGMENTASIFCDDEIVLDPKDTSLFNQQNAANLISHEIAHQWFGDLLTMKWWDDTWLNEGFATWIANKPLQRWRPDWKAGDFYESAGAHYDSFRSTHPVRTNIEDPAQLFAAFDLITYGKTAAVLRMLESYLGEESFRTGIRAYMKKHASGNATAEDLWSALAEASGKPVVPMMRAFIEQPGVPLVTVESSCKDNRTEVTLSQRRFFYDRTLLDKGSTDRWPVPVCLRRPSGTKCTLLSEPRQTVTLPACESWLLGNAGANGYYRVAYDEHTFGTLTANAAKALNADERSALVRDTWALVTAGREPVTAYLQLVGALDLADDGNLTERIARNLSTLGDRLATDSTRAAYQERIRSLLRPGAEKVGWDAAPGESDERRRLRAVLLLALGTTGADPETVATARARAERYFADPSSLDASLADTVLRIAAWNGDAALFDKLEAKAKTAKTHDELFRYLDGIQAFRDPALITRALDTLRSSVQPGELYFILPDMLYVAPTRSPAWEYLKAHWADIDAHQLYFARTAFIDALGTSCDAGHRADVESFFAKNDPKDARNAVRTALEQIDYCTDFRQQQQAAFDKWLAP